MRKFIFNIFLIMEYITLESHFWVPDHAIRIDTRNICSKELVNLIHRVVSIIAPEETIEVFILPPEPWSYTDVLKIIWSGIVWLSSIIGAVYAILTYHRDSDKIQLEMIKDCIETMQIASNLSKNIEIDDSVLNILCEDYGIKKIKNTRYKILEEDEMVEYEETVIKGADKQSICQSRIERQNFSKMQFALPEDEKYEKENFSGLIELVSLVVKQKKQGRGIAWKGTYFWNDIIYEGIKILEDKEDIDFFMQDQEFKQKIKNQEISFSNWDNMEVLFSIKADISAGIIKNRNIYVNTVLGFNYQIVPHTEKREKKISFNNQEPLFNIS